MRREKDFMLLSRKRFSLVDVRGHCNEILYHLTDFGREGSMSALSRQFFQIWYKNLTKKIMSCVRFSRK